MLRHLSDAEIVSMVAALKQPSPLETELMTRLIEAGHRPMEGVVEVVEIPAEMSRVLEAILAPQRNMVSSANAQIVCAAFMLLEAVLILGLIC